MKSLNKQLEAVHKFYKDKGGTLEPAAFVWTCYTILFVTTMILLFWTPSPIRLAALGAIIYIYPQHWGVAAVIGTSVLLTWLVPERKQKYQIAGVNASSMMLVSSAIFIVMGMVAFSVEGKPSPLALIPLCAGCGMVVLAVTLHLQNNSIAIMPRIALVGLAAFLFFFVILLLCYAGSIYEWAHCILETDEEGMAQCRETVRFTRTTSREIWKVTTFRQLTEDLAKAKNGKTWSLNPSFIIPMGAGEGPMAYAIIGLTLITASALIGKLGSTIGLQIAKHSRNRNSNDKIVPEGEPYYKVDLIRVLMSPDILIMSATSIILYGYGNANSAIIFMTTICGHPIAYFIFHVFLEHHYAALGNDAAVFVKNTSRPNEQIPVEFGAIKETTAESTTVLLVRWAVCLGAGFITLSYANPFMAIAVAILIAALVTTRTDELTITVLAVSVAGTFVVAGTLHAAVLAAVLYATRKQFDIRFEHARSKEVIAEVTNITN